MGDKKLSQDTEGTRVQPGTDEELTDEALESVAGGCQVGCSNMKSCLDPISMGRETPPIFITNPIA
jgi:hypothetical protein